MIEPYGIHVIVRRDDHGAPSDIPDRFFNPNNIIVAPQKAVSKSRFAKVLKVGPEIREDIREGDRVLITWLDGTKYEDADLGPVEVLKDVEILAVITP